MAKPHTGKFINCLNCSNNFYIPIYRFKIAKFCSNKCKGLYERQMIERSCNFCGKIFSHICSRVQKAKYCSQLCYHRSQIGKGSKEFICCHCGIKFFDSPSVARKYCSKSCVNKSEKQIFKPKFTTVRKMMLRRNMLQKCQICSYSEYPEILGVHHKDGNRQNNALENLQVLCPNCHSMAHRKHISH